jgi:beta-lactamase regulating signal transducer with metallopeptidase domain
MEFSTSQQLKANARNRLKKSIGRLLLTALQTTNRFSMATIAISFWLVGCVIMALRWCFSAIALRRSLSRCEQLDRELWEQVKPTSLASSWFNSFFPIRCLISEKDLGPASCGLFRPTILLPRQLVSELSTSQLRNIISHEYQHIRRFDVLLLALSSWVRIIHWLNPLAYILSRQLHREIELAVDAATIMPLQASERKDYGHLLIYLARRPASRFGLAQMADQRSAVNARIDAIVNPSQASLGRSAIAVAIISFLIVVGCTQEKKASSVKDVDVSNTDKADSKELSSSTAPHSAEKQDPDAPSKDSLYREYFDISSKLKNSEFRFVTREVSKGSPDGDGTVFIKRFKLFMFGDDAQLRVSWSNEDLPDWKSGFDFSRLGNGPTSSIEGADITICYRSKDSTTTEIMKIKGSGNDPSNILMSERKSEHNLGFFLPYVAANRKWNYRGEFASSGKSLVDEFFGFRMEQWLGPRRADIDGQQRWRVDISLAGGHSPLPVNPELGTLEGEDILSGWFEIQSPYRLREITKERRYYSDGVEIPIKFSGEKWWVWRVDLSEYILSRNGIEFPMEGRETMGIAVKPIQTFDEVASAYKNQGVFTVGSDHFLASDRSWVVKQIEKLESDEGIQIEPSPGMMIHNADAGTRSVFGK